MNALKRVQVDLPVPDLCREVGISVATVYKWRAKFDGMNTSMMTSMKELGKKTSASRRCSSKKNSRRRSPPSTSLKVTRPSRRREMAKEVVAQRGLTIRLACQAFGVSEHCYR